MGANVGIFVTEYVKQTYKNDFFSVDNPVDKNFKN
jgi:hypothetical protein